MTDRYPIVTDIVPSQKTVEVLKNLLFSSNGILTAHLSYLYQSWNVSRQNKKLGDYFKLLSVNDGEILNALGNIIFAFGGDPNFMTSNRNNWSSGSLRLSREGFVDGAILLEQNIIRQLKSAIEYVENESLKHLLSSIKEDKEKIVQDLTNLSF